MVAVKLGKDDWEKAALRAIAREGIEALSIPELARSLGVTKGSFYWHFKSLKALIQSALERWEEMDRAVLDEVRRISDPAGRLRALFVQAMEKSEAHALYVTLSAPTAPLEAKILARISKRRLQFLITAYRELGFNPRDARQRALLAYTAYIGALHLSLGRKKDVDAFVAHAVEVLIP